ncbi:MAG: protein translocase subunit SecF [Acidimicrobiales bacterium]
MTEHEDLTMDDVMDDALEDDTLDVDDAVRNIIRRRERDPHHHGPLARLYRGETTFDFVGRRRIWFTISTIIIVAGIISIILRGGLNLGIDFKGGSEWTVSAPGISQVEAVNAVQAAGLTQPVVDLLGQGAHQELNVQADLAKLSPAARQAEENRVADALAALTHTTPENIKNNLTTVGPTWGSQITDKAITALIIFFVVVGIYISIRFEPKMAMAAFIAMVHDVLIAVGIYSIFGFQVTPDTVVAILTILGYSLYDTVVVFDRVRDNTKGIGATGRVTYTQLINLSMNQTLARSINTSLVAILPVLAVLTIGAQIFGATTLQDYGLALFVGLVSGAYSSIFIAAPVLCMLKERESRWIAIARRNAKRSDRGGALSPAMAAALSTQMSISAGGQVRSGAPSPAAAPRSGPIRPGSAGSTAVLERQSGGRSGGSAGGTARSGGAPATGSGAGSGAGSAGGSGAGSAASGAGSGGGSDAGSGGGQSGPRPRKSKGKRKSKR